MRNRDAVADTAKLFHAGSLIRQARNAEGLSSIVRQFFGVGARGSRSSSATGCTWGRPSAPTWRVRARSSAPAPSSARRVWDRQHKFRLHLGPLTLAQYESFLPGGARIQQLVDWVRLYLCFELEWDVRLQLKQARSSPAAPCQRRAPGVDDLARAPACR